MRSVGVCAAVGVALLCGCAAKDAAKNDSSKVAQTGAPAAAPASRGSFDPVTHTAVIHAKDFAFDAPDSITAGWTNFHLVNDGPALHHVQIVRLDSGKAMTDLKQALSKPGVPPSWAVFIGGPNAADPTNSSDATFNLPAGNYALLCMIDLGDNIPHFAKGMARSMTVTATGGPAAAEPTADATVTLADYSFGLKSPLTVGTHTIRIVNNGPQQHELALVRFAPGKTSKDFFTWLAKQDGPPPGSIVGGVSGMFPGSSGYFSTTLAAGDYAFICFIPDWKDGKRHVEHGMIHEFKVS
jgi:hypothetical protein